MRYSAMAALMILTTVLLSACAQEQVAALEDKSGNFYGRNSIQKAVSTAAVFIPSFEKTYTQPASIDSVASRDLMPATQQQAQQPTTQAKPQPRTVAAVSPVVAPAPLTMQWPVNGTVTAQFGKQREGIANEGITIAAPKDSPIKASAGGQVAFVGNGLRDYGNMVILRHPNGDMTSYAHADRITVAKGMSVKQGDTIGYVGKSGRAKAPQLHFAMRSGDRAIDPLTRLPSQLASR